MNKKKFFYFSLILILVFYGCQEKDNSFDNCSFTSFEVRGNSMTGLLDEGEIICINETINTINRNDLVVFHNAGNNNPIIKVVKGIPGDELEVNGSYILINEEVLTISSKKPYSLSSNRLRMIQLYEGTIPEDTYLLLGNQVGGSLDSTRFGLISKENIIGVVKE